VSSFAESTIRATASCAGKTLLTSEGLGWTLLLVRTSEFAASMDGFETRATPDPRIVLFLDSTVWASEQPTSKINTWELPEVHSTREFPPARRPSK
jgi:hypothetical protein